MSKSEFIKNSGWAFVAGSFAFITILSNIRPSSNSGIGGQCNPAGSWDVRFAIGLW